MPAGWVQTLAGAGAGVAMSLPGLVASDPRVADIPGPVLAAIVQATVDAPCALDWRLLAGVSKAETDHGRIWGAQLRADGRVLLPSGDPIVSSAGAEGPFQFMPATAAAYGLDDPSNLTDAADAAARKLCADGAAVDPVDAAGRYNGGAGWGSFAESRAYVAEVSSVRAGLPDVQPARSLAAATAAAGGKNRTLGAFVERVWQRMVITPWLAAGAAFRSDPQSARLWDRVDDGLFGVSTPPAQVSSTAARPSDIVTVGSFRVAAQAAPSLQRMITAAAADGVTLTATSTYRTAAEQQALRAANCPDPVNSPPSACTPATARVGTSLHEQGLAVDFAEASWGWVAANAGRYGWQAGLVTGEPWHVEYAGAA